MGGSCVWVVNSALVRYWRSISILSLSVIWINTIHFQIASGASGFDVQCLRYFWPFMSGSNYWNLARIFIWLQESIQQCATCTFYQQTATKHWFTPTCWHGWLLRSGQMDNYHSYKSRDWMKIYDTVKAGNCWRCNPVTRWNLFGSSGNI